MTCAWKLYVVACVGTHRDVKSTSFQALQPARLNAAQVAVCEAGSLAGLVERKTMQK